MVKFFNERINAVFADMGTDYEGMNNLMQDLALGKAIFDGETEISKAEAEAKVLEFSRQIFGITDVNDKKAVRRAVRDHGREFMDIIEDTIDTTVTIGLKDTDFFNNYVDYRNIAYGDRQDFYSEDDAILSVAKAGTSHHDHVLQRLAAGQKISVPTALYVVEVGADINKYVLGQVDWAKLVAAITKAYMVKINEEIYEEFGKAVAAVPAQFKGTGALSATTKANFDAVLENVSAANDGAKVVILGTKAGLSKITALADVDWGSKGQRDSVAETGNIGIYEGTLLMEIPNRFKDKTYTAKQFDSKQLYIIPVGFDEKFIKFVDEGDTLILEKTERGDYTSDIMTYEVQRRFGAAVAMGKIFGSWVLPQ